MASLAAGVIATIDGNVFSRELSGRLGKFPQSDTVGEF
ncbi:hypothetical protein BH10ACI1_BH10ACI1_33110 [soil metagenome]